MAYKYSKGDRMFGDITGSADSNGDTVIDFEENYIGLVAGGTTLLAVSGSSVIINNAGGDVDFQVKGDNNSNVIRTDGRKDRVGILTDEPSDALDVNSNSIRIRTAKTPSSATDIGEAGRICWDSNYLYICIATNTWRRVPIDPWD